MLYKRHISLATFRNTRMWNILPEGVTEAHSNMMADPLLDPLVSIYELSLILFIDLMRIGDADCFSLQWNFAEMPREEEEKLTSRRIPRKMFRV